MSITPLPRPLRTGRDAPAEEVEVPASRLRADDAFLARAISRGDAAALEELISRYWEPLTSYASRIVGDMAWAEDVVQHTFVGIWSDRAGWSPRSIRAYLFRSTRNRALDEIRSSRARRERERVSTADLVREPQAPDAVLDAAGIADAVDEAIQQLPERRREAFVLAYLKQMTYSEVAALMGVSTKTVGHHISAALAELRKTLGHVVAEAEPGAGHTSVRPLHPRGSIPHPDAHGTS